MLRRERRTLLRVREERLRDLGGLMLEMYRRDQFRQDLLVERCEELMALDDRLQELETLLAAAVSVRRVAPPARCACGAPLPAGAHFCANCGRPVTVTAPVVACTNCGAAVSADAKFCAACGQAVGPEQQSEAARDAASAASHRIDSDGESWVADTATGPGAVRASPATKGF